MIKYLGIAVIVFAAMFNTGCIGCQNIEPGHVGVLIKKCSGGGVDPNPLGIGWQFRNLFCEEIEEYPTYQVTLVLTKTPTEGSLNDDSITVNSSEGLPINIDVSASLTIDGKKVPQIYSKYRNDIDHILHSYIKQTVREALQETAANYTAEQLYSVKRAEAIAKAQKFLVDKIGPDGFNITQFTINAMRPPQQVVDAINAKVAMIQQAQKADQEVKKIEAEARQRVARATGEAEAKIKQADAEAYYNKTVASSITPQLLEAQKIQAQNKAIDKWDGKMPQVAGAGGTPFIQLQK